MEIVGYKVEKSRTLIMKIKDFFRRKFPFEQKIPEHVLMAFMWRKLKFLMFARSINFNVGDFYGILKVLKNIQNWAGIKEEFKVCKKVWVKSVLLNLNFDAKSCLKLEINGNSNILNVFTNPRSL